MTDGWDIAGHVVSIGAAAGGIITAIRAWNKAADAAILAQKADDRAEEAHELLKSAGDRDTKRLEREDEERQAVEQGPIVLVRWKNQIRNARKGADQKVAVSRGSSMYMGHCDFELKTPGDRWAAAELAKLVDELGLAEFRTHKDTLKVTVRCSKNLQLMGKPVPK